MQTLHPFVPDAARSGALAKNGHMVRYLGSSPYCYANTLCTVTGEGWDPGLVETLTGSPFGFQMVGSLPLFDPPGWDPDTGVDQALALLGWACDRETFTSEDAAFSRLEELSARGSVYVGPLELGLLAHQPGADRPLGADHFVTVLEAGPEGVVMHDPQGHPYAWLPREVFLAAWGSETLGYGVGRFPLRSDFRRCHPRTADHALRELLPLARDWATGREASELPSGLEALHRLADSAEEGLGAPALPVLQNFSLRLGARRRADAAAALAAWPEVAAVLDKQARVLGGAQFAAVRADGRSLAEALREAGRLHAELIDVLGTTGAPRG